MEPLTTLLRRLQLVGGGALGQDQQWHILDSLYDFKPIITATLAVCLTSAFAWNRGFKAEAALWFATGLVVFAGRSVLCRMYRTRSPSASLQSWIDRFFVAAVLTALQWSLGTLILAVSQDGPTSGVVFAVEAALVGGAAARGYSFPAAALLQVYIVAGMISLSYLLRGQYVFSLLTLLYSVHQTVFILSVVRVKLAEIHSEQQRQSLLQALKQANLDLARANKRLKEIATTDALTGIANRRSFDAELCLRWKEGSAARTPLSLLMVDVDHFKRFNDMHGHPAGDRCLELVATAIASMARDPAIHAARYGGEEFALIMPDSDLPMARALAEGLQAAVRRLAVPIGEGRAVSVTVSVGIGCLTPDESSGEELLIALADQALYRAKQRGRDCIQVAASLAGAGNQGEDVSDFGP